MDRRSFFKALAQLSAVAAVAPADLFSGHSTYELTAADIQWGINGLLTDSTYRTSYFGIDRHAALVVKWGPLHQQADGSFEGEIETATVIAATDDR